MAKRGITWWHLPLERLTEGGRGLELVTAYVNGRREQPHLLDELRESAARYLAEHEPLFTDTIPIPPGKALALKSGSGPVQFGFKDGEAEKKRKTRKTPRKIHPALQGLEIVPEVRKYKVWVINA